MSYKANIADPARRARILLRRHTKAQYPLAYNLVGEGYKKKMVSKEKERAIEHNKLLTDLGLPNLVRANAFNHKALTHNKIVRDMYFAKLKSMQKKKA